MGAQKGPVGWVQEIQWTQKCLSCGNSSITGWKCIPLRYIALGYNLKVFLKYCFSIIQVWINQGDIILIGLRDYQDAKADVILKYTPDEARNLKTYGEFPDTGKRKKLFELIYK